MNRFVALGIFALSLSLSIGAPALAAEKAAPAPASAKKDDGKAKPAAHKPKTVKADQLKPGVTPKKGDIVELKDGTKVQFGGEKAANGAECICDPPCTDGHYCDGCLGCKI